MHQNEFENVDCKMGTILSQPQCVKNDKYNHNNTFLLR